MAVVEKRKHLGANGLTIATMHDHQATRRYRRVNHEVGVLGEFCFSWKISIFICASRFQNTQLTTVAHICYETMSNLTSRSVVASAGGFGTISTETAPQKPFIGSGLVEEVHRNQTPC